MAQYDITYACGHADTLQLYGPEQKREWLLEKKARGVCPDCYRAQKDAARDADRASALADAVAQGLPPLTGSDKQVGWALTVRRDFLTALDAWLEQNPIRPDPDADPLREAVASVRAEPRAKWWIDHARAERDHPVSSRQVVLLLGDRMTEIQQAAARGVPLAPAPDPVHAPSGAPILHPEGAAATGVPVKVVVSDRTVVVVTHERDEGIRDLLRAHLYAWDGSGFFWKHEIPAYRGDPVDAAAEIAAALLAAGVPVQAEDEAVRERVAAGSWTPEQLRWIHRRRGGAYDGWFMISFPYGTPNVFEAARAIRGSKYDRPNVVAPPEEAAAVRAFAAEYGFSLSPGARTLAAGAATATRPARAKRAARPTTDDADFLDGM
jgi:hypothetical protein